MKKNSCLFQGNAKGQLLKTKQVLEMYLNSQNNISLFLLIASSFSCGANQRLMGGYFDNSVE